MKKIGCITIILIIIIIGAVISQSAKEEAKLTPEQKTERDEQQKAGYDRGYPIGKLAAKEGRPERTVADLKDMGLRISEGSEHYATGFRKGWKDGYRQQIHDMKRLGIKPSPYVPPSE